MRPDNTEDESPLIYGLELQARALSSVGGANSDSPFVRFLVGTQSLKAVNQIHLLEYVEENHSLSKAIFKHPAGEIWNISSSPQNVQCVMTCYSNSSPTHEGQVENHCSLWRLPVDMTSNLVDEDNISSQSLEKVCDFDFDKEHIDVGKSALWRPDDGNEVVNYSGNKCYLWDVEYHKLISSFPIEDRPKASSKLTSSKITSVRWSPHSNCSILGVALGNSICGRDIRTKPDSTSSYAWTINAHNNLVRDLDFNPNAQYYVASCGDDGESRFWDIRKPDMPVVSLLTHSHWIWSIRYNQFHDQLVLTCSSDSRVILTRIGSLASQPVSLEDTDDISSDEAPPSNGSGKSSKQQHATRDEIVATFEEHEDSVYAAEWSSDPWRFASLSYDGRLVLNKVPKSEKFNILF